MSVEIDSYIDRSQAPSVKWERYRNRDILPMWLADMDLPVADPIRAALNERLRHPVYGYSAPPRELIEVVCQHLARDYGWEVEEEWLVWLPGVLPGLTAGCRVNGEEGDDIVILPPVFSEFFRVVDHAKRRRAPVPLVRDAGRWTLDFDRLDAVIGPNTSTLLLCSPNNPTGTVFTADELAALAARCERHDVVIVSDEIHYGLVLEAGKRHVPTAVAAPEYADRVITLLSPSKTFNLGGVNCAYAVIPNADLRARFRAVCESFGIMPMASAMGYTAALAAYRDGGAWHRALLEHLRANYAHLGRELARIPGLDLQPLEGTYLAWIDTAELRLPDPRAFFEACGVGFSPGAEFGAENYVRMNFACPRSTLDLALRRIAGGVNGASVA